jgi:hypothetical protein
MPRVPVHSLRRNALFCLLIAAIFALSYANFNEPVSNANPAPDFPSNAQVVINGSAVPPPIPLYRQDGLLEVNPDAQHPIYGLIDEAKLAWEDKLARQSKSLREACLEYKRRYHRNPPPGFDKW